MVGILRLVPKTYKVIDWQTSIKELLKIGNIEEAAHKLRYNLEGIFFYLASDLGAEVKLHRIIYNLVFGNLKKGVIRRVNEIIALANTSANRRNSDREKVKSFNDQFKDCKAYSHTEEWLINESIHFNPETVSANELREAVTAYIKLLDCLWCNKCHSWLQMYSSNSNESFQCNCKLEISKFAQSMICFNCFDQPINWSEQFVYPSDKYSVTIVVIGKSTERELYIAGC